MKWDSSWVYLEKTNVKCRNRCEEFLELAFHHSVINNKISCLFRDCKNKKMFDKDNVTFHLLAKGWYQHYAHLERWHLHNEPRQYPPPNRNDSDDQGPGDDVYYGGVYYHGLLNSLLHNPVDEGSSDPTDDGPNDAPPSETDDFREEVKELHAPLYPGYKNYFRLSFIIELYPIKSRGQMSDVTFGETVHFLKNVFPDINIPDSFYETKKLIRSQEV